MSLEYSTTSPKNTRRSTPSDPIWLTEKTYLKAIVSTGITSGTRWNNLKATFNEIHISSLPLPSGIGYCLDDFLLLRKSRIAAHLGSKASSERGKNTNILDVSQVHKDVIKVMSRFFWKPYEPHLMLIGIPKVLGKKKIYLIPLAVVWIQKGDIRKIPFPIWFPPFKCFEHPSCKLSIVDDQYATIRLKVIEQSQIKLFGKTTCVVIGD